MRDSIAFLLIILCSAFNASSQYTDTLHYTTANTGSNELPSSTVYGLNVGPDGYIWIGNPGKLTRFNGSNWLPLEYPDTLGNGNVLAFESNGNYWWHGSGKAHYFEQGTQQWSTFVFPVIPPSGCTSIIIDNADRVWFGTQSGIVVKDGPQVDVYTTNNGLSDDIVTQILQTSDGHIWAATFDGLNEWDGTSWSNYDFEVLFGAGHSSGVACLWESQNGALWAGNTDIVYCYENGIWTNIDITASTGFATGNGTLKALLQDDNGTFYFGFETHGIVTWNGTDWNHLTMNNGLTSDIVRCGLNDGLGRVWFGFMSGGIMMYENNQWSTWTTWDGLTENRVYSIYEDSQELIWLVNYNGINSFANNQWNSFNYEYRTNTFTGAIREDINNQIVYSRSNYISIYDGSNWEHIFGLSNVGPIFDLICLGSDTIIMGHSHGLTRAIGPNWNMGASWYNYTGLPNDVVNALTRWHNNEIWIGTNDGLAYLSGNVIQMVQVPGEQVGDKILDLMVDFDDNLWLATDEGAAKYNGVSWEFITENDGLVHNYIHCLEQLEDSSIWFGTNEGACQLKNSGWVYFTEQDNLISNRVFTIEEDHYGNLWFGTWEGVTKLQVDTTNLNSPYLNSNFREIRVYPNPATCVLNYHVDKSMIGSMMDFYSVHGQKLRSERISSEHMQINLSGIDPGAYVLRISSGYDSYAKKILILHQ
jgi:ligand-binding sensor domain-containing protein